MSRAHFLQMCFILLTFKDQNSAKFSVFHCNVRSLCRNSNSLVTCVERLQAAFNIITASETWLQADETVCTQGFGLLSQPRDSAARGSAVALLTWENVSRLCQVQIKKHCLSRLKKGPTTGVVPSSSVKTFVKEFEAVLMETFPRVHCKHTYSIVGHSNVDLSSDSSNEYTFLLKLLNMRNVITELPLCITSTSSTLTDHALCKVDNDVSAGVLPLPVADHVPIVVAFETEPLNAKPSRSLPRSITSYYETKQVKSISALCMTRMLTLSTGLA